MKLNELEIRILDWARKNICAVFKEKTLERVLAEARVILAGRKLESLMASMLPELEETGLMTSDGEIKTAEVIREVVLPALKNAGGLEFSMMGKRFSVEESDFDGILATGKEEGQEE